MILISIQLIYCYHCTTSLQEEWFCVRFSLVLQGSRRTTANQRGYHDIVNIVKALYKFIVRLDWSLTTTYSASFRNDRSFLKTPFGWMVERWCSQTDFHLYSKVFYDVVHKVSATRQLLVTCLNEWHRDGHQSDPECEIQQLFVIIENWTLMLQLRCYPPWHRHQVMKMIQPCLPTTVTWYVAVRPRKITI